MPLRRLTPVLVLMLAARCAWGGELFDVAPNLYGREAPTAPPDHAAAEQAFERGHAAAEQGRVSEALQLATAALTYDPNHVGARQVLGYVRVDGRWLTPFQKRQIERGFVWDPRFGWLKDADLPRYEAGERRQSRRWYSAQEDAERHATIEDGWQVRTDHFVVTTNHSREGAAALAAELESLFQIWRQLFAGYYLGEAEVRARFAGTRNARARSKPFNVIYHRDKPGYVGALRHKQPRIDATEGIYFDDLREAHFFAKGEGGKGKASEATANRLRGIPLSPFAFSPTLYHEAVHQLFQESNRSRRGVGAEHGFWAVEGVATYFESLTPLDGGRFAIGAPDAGRLPAARHRLLVDRYLVPLDEMASLGMADLQRRPDLPRFYGQLAATATFLMHAEGGRYREAFVRYLRDLYDHKAGNGALAEALGEPLDDLQVSYQRWMERLPN